MRFTFDLSVKGNLFSEMVIFLILEIETVVQYSEEFYMLVYKLHQNMQRELLIINEENTCLLEYKFLFSCSRLFS